MKISYNHIVNSIPTKPSIEELSEKLFQLGHENEVDKGIFDIEFTPNRGDCMSYLGIARELSNYFDKKINIKKSKLNPSITNILNTNSVKLKNVIHMVQLK